MYMECRDQYSSYQICMESQGYRFHFRPENLVPQPFWVSLLAHVWDLHLNFGFFTTFKISNQNHFRRLNVSLPSKIDMKITCVNYDLNVLTGVKEYLMSKLNCKNKLKQ